MNRRSLLVIFVALIFTPSFFLLGNASAQCIGPCPTISTISSTPPPNINTSPTGVNVSTAPTTGGSTGGSTGSGTTGGSTGSGTTGGTAGSPTTQTSPTSGSTSQNASSYPTCKPGSGGTASKTASGNVASGNNASCKSPSSTEVYDCTKSYGVKCNLNGKVMTNICNKGCNYTKENIKITATCIAPSNCKANLCDGKPCTQTPASGTGSTGSGTTDSKTGSPTTGESSSGSTGGSQPSSPSETAAKVSEALKQGDQSKADSLLADYYANGGDPYALQKALAEQRIASNDDKVRDALGKEIDNMGLGDMQFKPIGPMPDGGNGLPYSNPSSPYSAPSSFTGADQPGAYQPFQSAGISPSYTGSGPGSTFTQLQSLSGYPAGQSILTSALTPYTPPPMFTQQPMISTQGGGFSAPSAFYAPSSLSPSPIQTSYSLPPQYSLSESAYQQYKSAIAPSTFAPTETAYQLPAGFSGDSNIPYPQTWTDRAGAALVGAKTSAQGAVEALQSYAKQSTTLANDLVQSIINPQGASSPDNITNQYPPAWSDIAGVPTSKPAATASFDSSYGPQQYDGSYGPQQYDGSYGPQQQIQAPLGTAVDKLADAYRDLNRYQTLMSLSSADAGQKMSMTQAMACQMSPTSCLGESSNGVPFGMKATAVGAATLPGVGATPGVNRGNPFLGTETGWDNFTMEAGWKPPLAPIGSGGAFEPGGGLGSNLPYFASGLGAPQGAGYSDVSAPAAGILSSNAPGISPLPYADLSGLGTTPTIGKYDFANTFGAQPPATTPAVGPLNDSFSSMHAGFDASQQSDLINPPLSSRDAFFASQGIGKDVTPRTESGIPFSPPGQSSIGSLYNKNLTTFDDGASAAERARMSVQETTDAYKAAQARVDAATPAYNDALQATKDAEKKMQDAQFKQFTYDIHHVTPRVPVVDSKTGKLIEYRPAVDPKTGDPVYGYLLEDRPQAKVLHEETSKAIGEFNNTLPRLRTNAEILQSAEQDRGIAADAYKALPADTQYLANIGASNQTLQSQMAASTNAAEKANLQSQINANNNLATGIANSPYRTQIAETLMRDPGTLTPIEAVNRQILANNTAQLGNNLMTGDQLHANIASLRTEQALNLQPKDAQYQQYVDAKLGNVNPVLGAAYKVAEYSEAFNKFASSYWDGVKDNPLANPAEYAFGGALKGTAFVNSMATGLMDSGLNATGYAVPSQQLQQLGQTPSEIRASQAIDTALIASLPLQGPVLSAAYNGIKSGYVAARGYAGNALRSAIETVAGPVGLDSRAVLSNLGFRSNIPITGGTVSFEGSLAKSAGLAADTRFSTVGRFEQAFPVAGSVRPLGEAFTAEVPRLGSSVPTARLGGTLGDSFAAGVPRATTPLSLGSVPKASGVYEIAPRAPVNDNIAVGSGGVVTEARIGSAAPEVRQITSRQSAAIDTVNALDQKYGANVANPTPLASRVSTAAAQDVQKVLSDAGLQISAKGTLITDVNGNVVARQTLSQNIAGRFTYEPVASLPQGVAKPLVGQVTSPSAEAVIRAGTTDKSIFAPEMRATTVQGVKDTFSNLLPNLSRENVARIAGATGQFLSPSGLATDIRAVLSPTTATAGEMVGRTVAPIAVRSEVGMQQTVTRAVTESALPRFAAAPATNFSALSLSPVLAPVTASVFNPTNPSFAAGLTPVSVGTENPIVKAGEPSIPGVPAPAGGTQFTPTTPASGVEFPSSVTSGTPLPPSRPVGLGEASSLTAPTEQGKVVYAASRPVQGTEYWFVPGDHTFVAVADRATGDVTIYSADQSAPGTGTPFLEKSINNPADRQAFLDGSAARVQVTPPAGMTADQLAQNIARAHEALLPDGPVPYNPFGGTISKSILGQVLPAGGYATGANSNDYAGALLRDGAGATPAQIVDIRGELAAQQTGWAPGFGDKVSQAAMFTNNPSGQIWGAAAKAVDAIAGLFTGPTQTAPIVAQTAPASDPIPLGAEIENEPIVPTTPANVFPTPSQDRGFWGRVQGGIESLVSNPFDSLTSFSTANAQDYDAVVMRNLYDAAGAFCGAYGCSAQTSLVAQMFAGAASAETRANPDLVHYIPKTKKLSQYQGISQTNLQGMIEDRATIGNLLKSPGLTDAQRAQVQHIIDKYDYLMANINPKDVKTDPRMDAEVGTWLLVAQNFNLPRQGGFSPVLGALDYAQGNALRGAAFLMSAQLLPAIHVHPERSIGSLEGGKAVSLLRQNNVNAKSTFNARQVVDALYSSPNYQARFAKGITQEAWYSGGMPATIQSVIADLGNFMGKLLPGTSPSSAGIANNQSQHFPALNLELNKTLAAKASAGQKNPTLLNALSFAQLPAGASVTPYLRPFDFVGRLSLAPVEPFVVADLSPIARTPSGGVVRQEISPDIYAALEAGQEAARAQAAANMPLPPSRPGDLAMIGTEPQGPIQQVVVDAPLPPSRPVELSDTLPAAQPIEVPDLRPDIVVMEPEAVPERPAVLADLTNPFASKNIASLSGTPASFLPQLTRPAAPIGNPLAGKVLASLPGVASSPSFPAVEQPASPINDPLAGKTVVSLPGTQTPSFLPDLVQVAGPSVPTPPSRPAGFASNAPVPPSRPGDLEALGDVAPSATVEAPALQLPEPLILQPEEVAVQTANVPLPPSSAGIEALRAAAQDVAPRATVEEPVFNTPAPLIIQPDVSQPVYANVPTPPTRPGSIGSVAAPKAVVDINRTLRPGSVGEDVSYLQDFLMSRGFGTNMPLDGIYGPQTTQAVRDFQRAVGVRVDGIFGPETRAVLREESSVPALLGGSVSTPVPVLADPFAAKRLALYGGQVSPTPQPDFLPTLENAPAYSQDQLLKMYGFTPALLPKNISQQVAASILPPAPSAYPTTLPEQTNPMMRIPTIILSDKEIDLIVQEATDKINAYWTDVFAQHGLSYAPVKVILYGGHFDTSAQGGDIISHDSVAYFDPQKDIVYMDRSWLRQRSLYWSGANGATIMDAVGHEMAHRVVFLTGAPAAALSRADYDPVSKVLYMPGTSVQVVQMEERQADYLAGVSLRGAGLLFAGDPQNIYYQAGSSGDDFVILLDGKVPTADVLKSQDNPHGTGAERAQASYDGLLPTGSVEAGLTMLGTPLPWVEPNTRGIGKTLSFDFAAALATAAQQQANIEKIAGGEKAAFTSRSAGIALRTSMDGITSAQLLAKKVADIALYANGPSFADLNALTRDAKSFAAQAKEAHDKVMAAANAANGKMTPALAAALENGSVATRLSVSSQKLLDQAKDMIARQNAVSAAAPTPSTPSTASTPQIPSTPSLSETPTSGDVVPMTPAQTIAPESNTTPQIPIQSPSTINKVLKWIEGNILGINQPQAAEVTNNAVVVDPIEGAFREAAQEQFARDDAAYQAQQASRSIGEQVRDALSIGGAWASTPVHVVEQTTVDIAAQRYIAENDAACQAAGFTPVWKCTLAAAGIHAIESDFKVGQKGTADTAGSNGLGQVTRASAPDVYNQLIKNPGFRSRFYYITNFNDFSHALAGSDWRVNGPWATVAGHFLLGDFGTNLDNMNTLQAVLHRYNVSPTYPNAVINNMNKLMRGETPTKQSGRPSDEWQAVAIAAQQYIANGGTIPAAWSQGVLVARAPASPMAVAQARASGQFAAAQGRQDWTLALASQGVSVDNTAYSPDGVQPAPVVVNPTPVAAAPVAPVVDPALDQKKADLQTGLVRMRASVREAEQAQADAVRLGETAEALTPTLEGLRAGKSVMQAAGEIADKVGNQQQLKSEAAELSGKIDQMIPVIQGGIANPLSLMGSSDQLAQALRGIFAAGKDIASQAEKAAGTEIASIDQKIAEAQKVAQAAPAVADRTFGNYAASLTQGAVLLNPGSAQTAPASQTLSQQVIDTNLWNHYSQTPKVDNTGDFTYKDQVAAQRAGMSMEDFVVKGMNSDFRLNLFSAIQAMEKQGIHVGITAAFRDDYRQSLITSGTHAAPANTWHGGSAHGGYGHGLAADIVGISGTTNDQVWNWVDQYGQQYGIGRPYGQGDPPHVAPTNSPEYTNRRGNPSVPYQTALAQQKAQLGTQVAGNTGGAVQWVTIGSPAPVAPTWETVFNNDATLKERADALAGAIGFRISGENLTTTESPQAPAEAVQPAAKAPAQITAQWNFADAMINALKNLVTNPYNLLYLLAIRKNNTGNLPQPVPAQQTAGDNAPPPTPDEMIAQAQDEREAVRNEIITAYNQNGRDFESLTIGDQQAILESDPAYRAIQERIASLYERRLAAPDAAGAPLLEAQGGFPVALRGEATPPAALNTGFLGTRGQGIMEWAKRNPKTAITGIIGGGGWLGSTIVGNIANDIAGIGTGGAGAGIGAAGTGAALAGTSPAAATTLGSNSLPYFAALNQFPTYTQTSPGAVPPPGTVPGPTQPPQWVPRPGGVPGGGGTPSYPGYGNGYGYNSQQLQQAFQQGQQQQMQQQRAQQQAMQAQQQQQALQNLLRQQQQQQAQQAAQQKNTTPPTIQFSASPSTVTLFASTTLQWTSTNTTSCYIFDPAGKLITQGTQNGSYPIAAVTDTTTYSLTCTSYSYGQNTYATTTVMVATSTQK